MMAASTLRAWSALHKWSSLVCTGFMLLLCLTGLPLIFHHEIEAFLGDGFTPSSVPAGTPMANLDEVLNAARSRHPGKAVAFVGDVTGDGYWYVNLIGTPQSAGRATVVVDYHTAQVLGEPKDDGGFMHIVERLHIDLFAGLPGKLFLGAMALLMLVAIVSGVVLYAPFMRRVAFGTVRRNRPTRTTWLDLHNLLGIVTLVWAFVVGATGMINTLESQLIGLWRDDQMADMVAAHKDLPPVRQPGSLQAAVSAAEALEPGMQLGFVGFPGSRMSSPHHYAVFMRGTEPLTARLLKPVLVDAETGRVTDSRDMPWYMSALLLSQPLHFGDYGGMPLKILWAVLDVITIVVLGSGLYLWMRRRQAVPAAPKPRGAQPA
jgi:uncharacterized iron-regulated membrane protein